MSGISLANVDVGGIFTGLGTLAKDIRTAIKGTEPISADKAAELALKAEELQAQITKGQLDINLAEAQNPNLFVSGWRPFIGWICGISLAYHYVGIAFVDYFLRWGIPKLEMGELITILFGMLGLGGLRTVERIKGKA